VSLSWRDIASDPAYIQADDKRKREIEANFYREVVASELGDTPENRAWFQTSIGGKQEAAPSATFEQMNREGPDDRTLLGKAVDAMTTPWPLGYIKDAPEQTAPPTPPQTRYVAPRDAQGMILPEKPVEETLTAPYRPGAGTASVMDVIKTIGLTNPVTFVPALVAQIAEGGEPLMRSIASVPGGLAVDIPLGALGVTGAGSLAKGARALYEATPLAIPGALANLTKFGAKAAAKGAEKLAGDILPQVDDFKIPTRNINFQGKEYAFVSPEAKNIIETSIADAADVERTLNPSYVERAKKLPEKATRWFSDIDGNLSFKVSRDGPVGDDVRIYLENIKGANAQAREEITRLDKTLFKSMSEQDRATLGQFYRAQRTAQLEDVRPEMLHGRVHEGSSSRFLSEMKQNHPDLYEGLQKAAEPIEATRIKLVREMEANGLIPKHLADEYANTPYYLSRKFLEKIDPAAGMQTIEGKGVVMGRSGIPHLKYGASGAMIEDPQTLINDFILRSTMAMRRNDAAKALGKYAELVPDNAIGAKPVRDTRLPQTEAAILGRHREAANKMIDRLAMQRDKAMKAAPGKAAQIEAKFAEKIAKAEERIAKRAEKILQSKPGPVADPGYEVIQYMDAGEPKYVQLPKDMAAEFASSDPQITKTMASVIDLLSGSKVLKETATGYNLEFGLRNILRDWPHAVLVMATQKQLAPVLPVAAGQFAVNLARTAKDAFSLGKRPLWEQFVKAGGARTYYAEYGRTGLLARGLEKTPGLRKAYLAINHFLERTEQWTKLAAFQRALENGHAPHKAANIAANIVDFSQGGSVIKSLENFTPYVNAAVAGTRSLWRVARENPTRFAGLVMQLGVFAALARAMQHTMFPEMFDGRFSDTDLARNFKIPVWSYTDKEGRPQTLTIDIPKDQSQSFFAAPFEAMVDGMMGKKDWPETARKAWATISTGAGEATPVGPENMLPPLPKALFTYISNYDLFRRENVWKGPESSPSREYDSYTPWAWKKFGELTTLSPERSRAAFHQVFARNNLLNDMVGGGFSAVFRMMNPEERDKMAQEMAETFSSEPDAVRRLPGIRKITSTSRSQKRYDDIMSKRKQEATDEYLDTYQPINDIARRYRRMPSESTRAEWAAKIAEAPQYMQSGLRDRMRTQLRMGSVENQGLMMRLINMAPEARARALSDIIKLADDTERMQLIRDANMTPGFWSRRSRGEWNRVGQGGGW